MAGLFRGFGIGLNEVCGALGTMPGSGNPDAKLAFDRVRPHPPSHGAALAVRVCGHTQAVIQKRSACAASRQQKCDRGSRDRFTVGIYHPHGGIVTVFQTNAIDGAVAFQGLYLETCVLTVLSR